MMTIHPRFSLTTGLILASTLGTGLAGADESGETLTVPEQITAQYCAGITNGVRRLACYDALYKSGNGDEDNPVLPLEQVEPAILPLGVPELAGETDADDSDAGVMRTFVDQYIAAEQAVFSFSGSFVGHRPTYILPISWVKNPNPYPVSPRLGASSYDYELAREEAKYQISFKIPLLTGILDKRTTLWFGYTQQSFWQVYNQDESAPFRETNYEPELFFRYQTDYRIGPGTLNGVTIGFNHQSNGQSEPRSRSWNRIMASAAYSYDRWLFVVQPWYRIKESSKDDNGDIESYLGYADYLAVYKLSEDRTFSLKLRNNLESDNKTSVEFGYSFPMGDSLKGFFQYYNGYGESLIDYNRRIERFGFGIMLNDWL